MVDEKKEDKKPNEVNKAVEIIDPSEEAERREQELIEYWKEREEKERRRLYTPDRKVWESMPEVAKDYARELCRDVDNLEERIFEHITVSIYSVANCYETLTPLLNAIEQVINLDPTRITWNYNTTPKTYPTISGDNPLYVENPYYRLDLQNDNKEYDKYFVWVNPVSIHEKKEGTTPKENLQMIKSGITHSFTRLNTIVQEIKKYEFLTEKCKLSVSHIPQPEYPSITQRNALKIFVDFVVRPEKRSTLTENLQKICRELTTSAKGDIVCRMKRYFICDNYFKTENINEDLGVVIKTYELLTEKWKRDSKKHPSWEAEYDGFVLVSGGYLWLFAYDRGKDKLVEIEVNEDNLPFLERIIVDSVKIRTSEKKDAEDLKEDLFMDFLYRYDNGWKFEVFENDYKPALQRSVLKEISDFILNNVWEKYGGGREDCK